MKNYLLTLVLSLMTCALSVMQTGCTIGPTVETRYVAIKPGQPIRILENRTVRGDRLDNAGVAEFDIGGWIAMPPEHWEAVKRSLEKGNQP